MCFFNAHEVAKVHTGTIILSKSGAKVLLFVKYATIISKYLRKIRREEKKTKEPPQWMALLVL